jgi:hypothetical protein
MKVSKLTPILVLCASVALGYLIASRTVVDYNESKTLATEAAVGFDDTCSAASPDAVTCEMPEEISRADYFRLVATGDRGVQQVAQANQRNEAGRSTGGKPNILVITPQLFNPANMLDDMLREIRDKQRLERTFPMLADPVLKEAEND